MNTTKQTKLTPRLHARLSTYATLAGVALTAPALAPSVKASIVSSGPLTLAIPNTIDGVYINFVTGATGTSGGAVPGFDFNPYSGTGGLLFYWGGDAGAVNGGVASTANGPYLVLGAGSIVGPGSTFSQAANGANAETAAFQAGVTGYLGVRFTNESTGATDYGYVHLQTTGATGFPATILDYAYENTGAAITVVPEPTTTATLALGVLTLGAAGVRRWRQARPATV